MTSGLNGVMKVETRDDFARFLAELLGGNRSPVVAVSIAEDATSPTASVDELHRELGDAAQIFVLSAQATFWLTDKLGKEYSVHSGWVRVYPANRGWRADSGLARLLPARANKRRWMHQIVDTVLDAAYADGYRPETAAPNAGVRDTAVVQGYFSPTQVSVRTGRNAQGIMRTNCLWPGIPAERLVAIGQRFEGVRHSRSLLDDFVPDPITDDAAERARTFVGDGIVTSATVTKVTAERAELRLHPHVTISVSDGDVDMHSIISSEEVVTVEVVAVDGQFVATFSAQDAEPAMSLLPGGPPWLIPAPRTMELPADDTDASADAAGEASPFEHEIEHLDMALQAEREKNRLLRQELREQRRFSVPRVYTDPCEQLRLELHLSYLTRVTESERGRYPWPAAYRISDEFVDTVDQLVKAGGIGRHKIIEVCADVLCGQAQHIPARAVKEWKESTQGSAIRRADGATCMRVRLQQGANAARRLRYWRLATGEIELDWVGVHDAELH